MKRKDIIRMAAVAGELKCICCLPYYEEVDIEGFEKFLERFAALVAAHEREGCAKVCEAGVVQTNNWDASDYNKACEIRAAAIRNREEK
jgi:hypothetical protein